MQNIYSTNKAVCIALSKKHSNKLGQVV